MLSSISPVGEAARRQRYAVTLTAYLLGSALGGLAVGAAAGTAGALLLGWLADPAALLAFAALALAGLALDLTRGVPSAYRQVDEGWLTTYRGWVYGLGFGVQLGTGIVTVVPSSLVYLTWVAAALSRSATAGAVVGLAFGVARGLPLVTGARVRTPARLRRLMARVDRLRGPVANAMRVGHGVMVVITVLLALV